MARKAPAGGAPRGQITSAELLGIARQVAACKGLLGLVHCNVQLRKGDSGYLHRAALDSATAITGLDSVLSWLQARIPESEFAEIEVNLWMFKDHAKIINEWDAYKRRSDGA